jgi:hypothetical protein
MLVSPWGGLLSLGSIAALSSGLGAILGLSWGHGDHVEAILEEPLAILEPS